MAVSPSASATLMDKSGRRLCPISRDIITSRDERERSPTTHQWQQILLIPSATRASVAFFFFFLFFYIWDDSFFLCYYVRNAAGLFSGPLGRQISLSLARSPQPFLYPLKPTLPSILYMAPFSLSLSFLGDHSCFPLAVDPARTPSLQPLSYILHLSRKLGSRFYFFYLYRYLPYMP